VGVRPATVVELDAVIRLTGAVHGEWVRIHPFANGSGRTARLWAAWLALRYSLPLFVQVKPRPNDAAYAQASFASMGRPPHFTGDHSVPANVFTHLLSLSLVP
jgi:Fic family protein